MSKLNKVIYNLSLTLKKNGIKQVIILVIRYINNIAGGCGLKVEICYKLHYLISKLMYKSYTTRFDNHTINNSKFRKDEYVLLYPEFNKSNLDLILKKCKNELQNEKNITNIANKNNKPFNGLLSSSISSEYYSKQVCWLSNPSKRVPELLRLVNNEYIDSVLKNILRSNYTIENIAMYESLNNNSKETYNLNSKFHTDSNPSTSLKMMVYLCDVDHDNGPFLIKNKMNGTIIPIIGKAGTTVIFKSHSIYHAAKNTILRSRFAVFFTIVPSIKICNDNVTCDAWLNIPYRINPFLRLGK
jgi:hypothetical protein